ncbi:hypothetical protein Tco_1016327 [Tanacetum coccineum]|uniref:Uncharacterized protein n=1 Tax=Tanacetum coccineum TaxID=301880 RepID=A0ABQ5FNC9_9ASTR
MPAWQSSGVHKSIQRLQLMINDEGNDWPGLKVWRARLEDLEASAWHYKKTSLLTHREWSELVAALIGSFCLAKGSRNLEDKILVPVPDSSPCCARYGTPVDGPSCRGCAFLRKKFDEDLLHFEARRLMKYMREIVRLEFENLSKILIYGEAKFKTKQSQPTYERRTRIISKYGRMSTSRHYSTTQSDEVIKVIVLRSFPIIPSEFEGISDDTCDVPNCDDNRVHVESELVESLINRDTSIDYSSKMPPLLLESSPVNYTRIAPNPREIDEARF